MINFNPNKVCTIPVQTFNRKFVINPLVGASLVTGAGSLVSGLFGGFFGNKTAKDTAKAQLQATRETNEANKQIAQENNAFNERMVDKMNDYNSAVNQRARLEAAGLNPNIMMDGSSAGIATSAPTADTSGTQQVPNMSAGLPAALQGIQSISDGIANAANVALDMKFKQAQINDLNASAGLKGSQQNTLDSQLPYLIKGMDLDVQRTDRMNKKEAELYQADIDTVKNQLDILISQKEYFRYDTTRLKLENDYSVKNPWYDKDDPNSSQRVSIQEYKVLQAFYKSKVEYQGLCEFMNFNQRQQYMLMVAQTYAAQMAGNNSKAQAAYTERMLDLWTPDYISNLQTLVKNQALGEEQIKEIKRLNKEYLQKEIDWYAWNHSISAVINGVGAIGNLKKGGKGSAAPSSPGRSSGQTLDLNPPLPYGSPSTSY